MASRDQICQIEIPVDDLDLAEDFFRNVFGWHIVPADLHNCRVVAVPPDSPLGITLLLSTQSLRSSDRPIDRSQRRHGPIIYLNVEDGHKTAKQFGEHGGLVKFGPKSLPAYGKIWQTVDPFGNTWGLFEREPEKKLSGAN